MNAKGRVLLIACATLMSIGSFQIWGEDDGEASHRALAIRYAKTKLRLAEVELERASSMNERHILPQLTLEQLRSNLTIANEQYKRAVADSTDGSQKVQLRHAEERLRLAKLSLDATQNLKSPGRFHELDLQRHQLGYELAQLNLKLLQQPENVSTQMDYLQRRIDRFGDVLLLLEERIARLESRVSR